MSGSVNTAIVGTYTLSYSVTDSQGNQSNIVTRTVIITDQSAPVVTLNGSGTIAVEAQSGAIYTDI